MTSTTTPTIQKPIKVGTKGTWVRPTEDQLLDLVALFPGRYARR